MQTKITVEFSDKDIRELLIEKAKEAIKDRLPAGSTATVSLAGTIGEGGSNSTSGPAKVDGLVTFNGVK